MEHSFSRRDEPGAGLAAAPGKKAAVLVVAGSENTLSCVERQIAEYLGGDSGIVIAGHSCSARAVRSIEDEAAALVDPSGRKIGGSAVILVTSAILHAELLEGGFLGAKTPVIVAERTIDPEQLDRVVGIKPGERVLLVNDDEGTARECADALRDMGLDTVRYLPWWPGCPAPDPEIRIAITPGEADLVPPGFSEIIDLGPRVLDFGTLTELLNRLGLLERGAGKFSMRYLNKIVQMARRLALVAGQERRIAEHFKGVLDSLNRGILVYDGIGRVSVCTEGLVSLLHLPSRRTVGVRLSSLVRNQALLEFLENGGGDESGTFSLADRDIVVRRFDSDEGRVAIFRDLAEDLEAARSALQNQRRGHVAKYVMDDILGDSQAIQRARRIAGRLAATDLSILILGETGTGKELFASAIHAASARRSGPFLAVDLGALSDDLIESELFGYEEGAFTGARKGGKPGLFELADGGTIFLDEIGNVSVKVQNRLLRILQEKEVLRVGGSTIHAIDVRVIAATNGDLLGQARDGRFREDLYFRLKTGILRIPPLRERKADIPLLLGAFVRDEGHAGIAVDPSLLGAIEAYDWPGNVRELKNLVTYMLAVREGPGIALCDLPDEGFFEGLARPGDSCSDDVLRMPPVTGKLAAPRVRPDDTDVPANDPGGLLPEERFLLGAIADIEAGGAAAGREKLALKAMTAGDDLSPAMVRQRLAGLARRGLLISRRGRRGTRLTDAGWMIQKNF